MLRKITFTTFALLAACGGSTEDHDGVGKSPPDRDGDSTGFDGGVQPVDAGSVANDSSVSDAIGPLDSGCITYKAGRGICTVCHTWQGTSDSCVPWPDAGNPAPDAANSTDASSGHDSGTHQPVDAGIDAPIIPPPPAPTCTDGIKNGQETDIDCGGTTCPACPTGDKCVLQTDCAVGGCDYTGHCITSKSCTQHHGGDTCGAGEDTDLGANPTPATGEESCCVSIQIPGTSYMVDKYLITSGRMRAMVNDLGGNLRAFTQGIPASNTNWNPAWNAYIPSTVDEVDAQLGPYPAPLTPDPYNPDDEAFDNVDQLPAGLGLGQWRDGCTMGAPGMPDGARTWWTNKVMNGDLAPVQYPQDFLDDKMLNCVDSYLLTAFCIWDGGHLATLDELANAWGTGQFPWSGVSPNVNINLNGPDPGDADHATYQMPLGVDSNGLDMSSYVVHEFGAVDDEFITPYTYNYDPYNLLADNTYHIAAPGRFPLGAGPYGHMDMVGESYPATAIAPGSDPSSITSIANVEHTGTTGGTGSWEIHPIEPGSGTEQEDPLFRPAWWAYYAMGGRCAR